MLHIARKGLAYTGNKDIVAYFKFWFSPHLERQHPPVHDIGTVPFGCIFLAYIGQSSQDALAAGSLFTGRAVTGTGAVNHAADFRRLHRSLWEMLADRLVHTFQIRVHSCRALSGKTCLFQFLDVFGPSHVTRIAAGQGKLSKTQGIGTIRTRFS